MACDCLTLLLSEVTLHVCGGFLPIVCVVSFAVGACVVRLLCSILNSVQLTYAMLLLVEDIRVDLALVALRACCSTHVLIKNALGGTVLLHKFLLAHQKLLLFSEVSSLLLVDVASNESSPTSRHFHKVLGKLLAVTLVAILINLLAHNGSSTSTTVSFLLPNDATVGIDCPIGSCNLDSVTLVGMTTLASGG